MATRSRLLIEAGGETGRIVAESPRYCYWLLPTSVGPGRNQFTLHEGSHVVQFSVIVLRMDLMQVLEDEGATAATGPPSSASSAESG